MKQVENKIIEIIEKIKPFLAADGGDLEFVKYENGIVYIKMLGNCSNCEFAGLDISSTIETILTSEIPEITEVRQYVDSNDQE